MRIILWLAAGVAATATGSAAAARPGGAAPGGTVPSWSYGAGHHIAKGGPAPSGVGWIGTDRRHRPGHGRFGRFGRLRFYPYGGFGIAGPAVNPYGNGFFTGAGGQISLKGGRPHYDYDRSYPYEWASAAGRRRERVVVEERASEPAPRCTFENGVRVCRGW